MQLDYTIYPGRANAVKIALTDDAAAINHLSLTRLAVYVGSTLFDLSHADHVVIKLGSASPALATGKYSCKLVVYDSGDFSGGYIWPEAFVVTVLAEPG